MRVIIAGSRGIIDYAQVERAMKLADLDVTEIVSGGARGVDTLGERWASEHDVPVQRHLPDWNQYGRSAGFCRNGEMAQNADALVAIWDGKSRGTQDMILQAQVNKLLVFVVIVEA
jgi:hypothetical protein